ncbi:hypothetical protein AB0L40_25120, partial [Patulibacter sp. NPDC049589]
GAFWRNSARAVAGSDFGTAARPARRAAAAGRTTGDADPDPLGPEALGYAVPRSGLPRPARRPAVPRVRRRRRRRPPSAAVAAAATAGMPPEDEVRPGDDRDTDADEATGEHTSIVRTPSARTPEVRSGPNRVTDTDDDRTTSSDRTEDAAGDHGDPRHDDPATDGDDADRDGRTGHADDESADDRRAAVAPVTGRGVTAVGRRVLQVPIVRQLGVPAVLLLAVLLAALIAAGVFAGQQQDSVAPITRPTIPTVPANPDQIPPLP